MPVPGEFRDKATVAYIAPFLVFVAIMTAERAVSLSPGVLYPIRFAAVLATLFFISRPVISLRPSAPWGSVAIGIAVFAIWVGPDLLFGTVYRQHWLFDNAVMGHAVSSIPDDLRRNMGFITIRTLSCVVTVPILEELFWRGWLMRWLIERDFLKIPVGTYATAAFWIVALLFASEHGSYWDVGLVAGVVYNWWCVRTKNLADCILAHAVTNAMLSAYVLLTGQWQYWL